MQISQERGATSVDVTTGGVYTVDQWIAGLSATPGGTLRAQQVASVTPGGSPFRLRHTVQVADTSIAAGDVYVITQPIEGWMVADARFGSASARQLILRFGVRSSVAGTFAARIHNHDSSRSWIAMFTIAAGEINTDVVRTFVVPGSTTGTWLTDAGLGMSFQICLAAGATWHGVAGWQNGNAATTSAQTNLMATAGATFDLFDVGLYVDPLNIGAAPPWELPAWDADLRACQRYFEWVPFDIGFTSSGANNILQLSVPFVVDKRATPVFGSIVADPAKAQFIANSSGAAFNGSYSSTRSGFANLTATASGNCQHIGYRSAASARL
jgi:hypothetical protein